jgi:LPS O-antigen subunit length determinant protein (WzzB/FepE family)
MYQIQDDEYDLFDLFITLWDGKWKIIATTFVAAVIGITFSVVKPNSYEVSTPIQIGKQSVFFKYTSLNDLLNNNQFPFSISDESIFKMFILEFNDYKEMVDAVNKSEFVQESIKDLDEADKQRKLINFAKSFKLKDGTLSFVWHDDLEGIRLFNDAIRQTLSNVRNITKVNVNELAKVIDLQNTRYLDKLSNKLSIIERNQINVNKKRIQYLEEQSAIAKELGIELNVLDANTLSQSSQNGISLNINSQAIPYYLRGYKAINKEVLLIQNRSDNDNLLAASGYVETKEDILSLEKDLSSSQFRIISKVLENDNPNNWVEFDLAIADVKSTKTPKLYVFLSIILGGMVGAIYVLILNAIRKRKESSA